MPHEVALSGNSNAILGSQEEPRATRPDVMIQSAYHERVCTGPLLAWSWMEFEREVSSQWGRITIPHWAGATIGKVTLSSIA